MKRAKQMTDADLYREKRLDLAPQKSLPAAAQATRVRGGGGAGGAAKRSYSTVPLAVSAPINNMGENLQADAYHEAVVISGGKVKKVLTKLRAEGELCIIDWLNVTVHEDTWQKTARGGLISTEDVICEASKQLEKILGFGVTSKRDFGMNYYKESWVLGDDMGYVCLGGQRNTMLITLTGQGCVNAIPGWEKRLHWFLANVAARPSISRIDLAHDDFDGKYISCDWAESQWAVRGFNTSGGGRKPNIERVGNWHEPSGKGRTLTVGLRSSGKFFRGYEKGMQLGDVTSSWFRAEVEFKSVDRVIPLDILIEPSDYFAGAYPCFKHFANIKTEKRIKLKEKVASIVMESAKKITKHQYGKYLSVFRQLFGDKETLDLLCHEDKNAWPKRLKPLGASVHTGGAPIHETRIVRDAEDFLFVPKAGTQWAANVGLA